MQEYFSRMRRSILALAMMALTVVSVNVPVASAAPLKGFEALQVSSSGSGTFRMLPGEVKPFTIQFKNTGGKAWKNEGPAYVSIYTYGPKYRSSKFFAAGWRTSIKPAALSETEVPVGGVGTITFDLKAPTTPGTYDETFNLAAEDIAWIPGGLFTVHIVVAEAGAVVATPAPAPITTPVVDTGLSAMTLIRSAKTVTVAKGGDVVEYTVGIKNTGTISWSRGELRVPETSLASVSLAADTRHPSWLSTNVVAATSSQVVEPGALEFFTFKFRAPKAAGSHTVRYAFAANNEVIPEYYVDIPVTVTSGAPDAVNSPIRTDLPETKPTPSPESFPLEEPMLRVGILIVDEETDNQVVITSKQSNWKVFDGNGALLAEMKKGEEVTAFYKNNRYYFNRGKGLEQTSNFIRFVPDEANAVMEVTNWDRRLRGSDRPYNTYRNVLELHYNPTKDRTWLINELPIELYLKGLGETSNVSHLEYQKALITAARTYATYHWQRGTKRAAEFFHVTGYADDQVYRGYGQEEASPRIAQSAEATRGQIVTYNGELAITPYFSRSSGRTLDWSEVWGGSVDWLKSKPAPCDKQKGYQLWGHGVGMSATEALCMANNGESWDTILKYFYTGIELKQMWK